MEQAVDLWKKERNEYESKTKKGKTETKQLMRIRCGSRKGKTSRDNNQLRKKSRERKNKK